MEGYDEYQQPQANPPPMDYYQQQLNQLPPDLILKLVSGDDIIEACRNYLEGRRYNETEQKWELPDNVEPIMNEYGRNKIIALLQPIASRNSTMSNLEDWLISNLTEEFNLNLNALIANNWEAFGMKYDFAMWSEVCIVLSTFVNAALKRGMDKTTLNFLKSTYSHTISDNKQQEKKRGLLDKLNPFGGH